MLVTKEYNGSTCAPPRVYSFHQAMYYCGSGSGSGSRYSCSGLEEECEGIIDRQPVPPPCTKNITACSPLSYMTTCVYDKGLYDQDFLPEIAYNHHTGIHDCNIPERSRRSSSFQCWDKTADQWCLGEVTTPFGTWDNPSCPTGPVASCRHLAGYGYSPPHYCFCSTELGLGRFACRSLANRYDSGWANESACIGTIDTLQAATDDELSLLPTGFVDTLSNNRHPACPTTVLTQHEYLLVQDQGCLGLNYLYMYKDGFYHCNMSIPEENSAVECYGLVDDDKDLPECTNPTILSCQLGHYYEACAEFDCVSCPSWLELRQESCHSNNVYKRTAGTFQCRDRVRLEQANESVWCRGRIATINDVVSFERPTCPSTIRNFHELVALGLSNCNDFGDRFECMCYVNRTSMDCVPVGECICATNTNGCYPKGGSQFDRLPWCSGSIDASVPSVFSNPQVLETPAPSSMPTQAPTLVPNVTENPTEIARTLSPTEIARTLSPTVTPSNPSTTSGRTGSRLHVAGCTLLLLILTLSMV